MKKCFAALLLIFAFTSVAFCQISGQQPLIRIESMPVPDILPKEEQPTVKGAPASFKEVDPEKPQGINRQEDESSGRAWVSAEYLLWKMRGSNLPPLITVAPGDRIVAALGQPGTVIAFGGGRLDQGRFPGARLTAGLWLNNRKTVGAEVSYFFLKKKTFRFQVSSNGLPGSPTISRPYIFVDLSTNIIRTVENASPIAVPGFFQPTEPPTVFSGTGTGTFSSRLQGAEGSMLYRLGIMRCCRMILLTGFRYLDLNQALTVEEFRDRRFINFDRTEASHESLTDQFNTRNQFYGGQAGLRSTLSKGRLSLELSGTIALGSNHQSVNIRGARTSNVNPEGSVPEGLLAIKTNIGRYSRNRFTFIPEARANLGFDLTGAIRPFIGYQFLYWNRVVMPGEQVDRFVNFLFVVGPGPGPRRPAFSFRDTTFWAQGLTTGVKVRF